MRLTSTFWSFWTLTSKVGQGDLFLVCSWGSLLGLSTQDYKSVCAAVMICATLADPKLAFTV